MVNSRIRAAPGCGSAPKSGPFLQVVRQDVSQQLMPGLVAANAVQQRSG